MRPPATRRTRDRDGFRKRIKTVFYSFGFQVEYAIEAINNAGTCVGILAKDGIVMASERRITSGLFTSLLYV